MFTNNTSYYGTVFNLSSVADFTRCRITGSTGNYGAISSSGPGGINISDSVFLNNATSVWTGAAMTAQGPGTYIVTDTLFAGNVAANDGGAIRSNVQQLSLINCVFSGNSAAADGGALSLDGNPNGAQTTISNCTFAGHTANLGRAIAMETPSPSFTLELIVANSIFWNGGSEIWEDGSIGVDTTITYSNIEGGWPGVGNLAINPLFVDSDGNDNLPGTEDDNLRLSDVSPCLNVGDNGAVVSTTDADGMPRIAFQVVDLGAYEFPDPAAQGGVPTTSEWGLCIMLILLVTSGTLLFRRSTI